ncbi:MAG: sugar phosphate isomerase/epimerase [Anaerolineae bacterium]|nr:sugar phosphate isomerase/epimerase [Anaerolineae bacterium]
MTTIALSTGSLYTYGTARVFELAAEAGFDGVELLLDDRWDVRHPAYLTRLMRDTGLSVTTVHNPFMAYVSGWPCDPVQRLERSAALARELGVGVVVAHLPLRLCVLRIGFLGFNRAPWMLPLPWPAEGNYRRFLLEGLPAFEAEHGVLIGVENMPAKQWLGRRWGLYQLGDLDTLSGLPHLTLDVTHLGTWGLDPVAVYERLKARIVHVHLSNYDGQEHRRPDQGHLPLAELLRAMARDGYAGAVTLELGPDVLEAEDEGKVRGHLKRALAFCRQHLTAA